MRLIVGIVSRKRLNLKWEAINQSNNIMCQVDPSLIFKIFHPKGRLSAYIQGMWSASVPRQASTSIKRWLLGDAGSGIWFNLGEAVYFDEVQYSSEVILLPVSKHAHSITLPPGSRLAGVRFHPAIGFGILGAFYEQPTTVTALKESSLPFELETISRQLINTPGHHARIITLYRWLTRVIDFTDVVPKSLIQALDVVQRTQVINQLPATIPLSQRQLERQFQKWLGMTPKEYQRIIRVKKAITFLKNNPDTGLVDLAFNAGFTDQAHMTREFKQIAKITPRQYSKLMACRQL